MLERLGGGALILHYNIRRVWIIPEYAPGPRAQCGCSGWRSAALLRYGLVAGGCLIYFGDQMMERLGGGCFNYPLQYPARVACFLFLIYFLIFLETFVIVGAYQKRTTQQ
jgi:hypothetical protein